MTGISGPAAASPIAPAPVHGGYMPGVCNIGPAEIRRRRGFAFAAFAIAAVTFAALVATGAPSIARMILILPLWGASFSWLQARRRFCAAFAMAGIANFGDDGSTRWTVEGRAARRADMLGALRLARDSFGPAFLLALLAVVLPI